MDKIGKKINNWQLPVFALGPHEQDLDALIRGSWFSSCMNINDTEWEKHCETTDEVLRCVMTHVKKFANENFEGLIINDDVVRFGSSRDGLKVIDALEFDCILLFDISGMIVSKELARYNSSEEILGMMKLCVNNAKYLISRFPWIEKTEIFKKFANGKYFLNTKNLQEKVFKSIIDKTRKVINDQLHDIHSPFFIRRTSKPPTFDINITLNKEKDITDLRDDIRLVQGVHVAIESDKKPSLDIDFVPAFHLRNDRVPNPYTEKLPHGFGIEQMNCQVYAVMKWAHRSTEASSTFDSDCLWRECTSGYEKQILDICRRNNSQRYLMTACRLLKSYVANQHKTNQIRSVAASQHLKTICFYCVTFLTTPSDHNSLSGLKEALGYFLFFLGLCIESKNLPHFFFGNPWLCTHFPHSSFGHGQKQKNLYSSVKWETYRQASLSYTNMLDDLKGLYTESCQLDTYRIEQFKEHLGLKHTYRKPKFELITSKLYSVWELCICLTILMLKLKTFIYLTILLPFIIAITMTYILSCSLTVLLFLLLVHCYSFDLFTFMFWTFSVLSFVILFEPITSTLYSVWKLCICLTILILKLKTFIYFTILLPFIIAITMTYILSCSLTVLLFLLLAHCYAFNLFTFVLWTFSMLSFVILYSNRV
ncbi:uncharacterized protein LOC127714201 [Mytilus californianus]|uniref:uncharacterized protein LOC127714201 n=1 Tax=Mytilus californianus TaxID=6549 RepID=UPI002246907A|nr:uncharacterized protein LOC127714201 [Mytilus californianus]XP_052076186.1 uncharacterized protein LOC127714201 [Mytilus californianus]